MYEFWYHYIKEKNDDIAKLCQIDTGSFILHIKTEDFEYIKNDVEKKNSKHLFHLAKMMVLTN